MFRNYPIESRNHSQYVHQCRGMGRLFLSSTKCLLKQIWSICMLHVCILCLNILSLVSYISYSSLSSFMESCTGARTKMTTDPPPQASSPLSSALSCLVPHSWYFQRPCGSNFLGFHVCPPISPPPLCLSLHPFFSCLYPQISSYPSLLYRPWFFSMPVVPKSGIAVAGGVG